MKSFIFKYGLLGIIRLTSSCGNDDGEQLSTSKEFIQSAEISDFPIDGEIIASVN